MAQTRFEVVPLPPESRQEDRRLGAAEPLAAFDPAANGHLYVLGAPSPPRRLDVPNSSLWVSRDGGRTFDVARYVGTLGNAVDVDLTVGADHTVYLADIQGLFLNVCRSHDGGRTFGDGCEGGLASNPATSGEVDRQWIVADPDDPGRLYLAVKQDDLPHLMTSADGGETFVSCPPLLDPGGRIAAAGGRSLVYMGRPVLGDGGRLHVPMATSGDQFVLGVVTIAAGCAGIEHDAVINVDRDATSYSFGVPLARGADAELWFAATGTFETGRAGVFVFRSTDGGATWSRPIRVGPEAARPAAFAAVTGGLAAGRVAVGWYEQTDPELWTYEAALSYDGAHSFVRASTRVEHRGPITPQGVLRDFSSATTDPRTGCAVFAIPYSSGSSPARGALAIERAGAMGSCLGASSERQPQVRLLTRRLSARRFNRGRARMRARVVGPPTRRVRIRLVDGRGRVYGRGRAVPRPDGRTLVRLRRVRRISAGRYRAIVVAAGTGGWRITLRTQVRLTR